MINLLGEWDKNTYQESSGIHRSKKAHPCSDSREILKELLRSRETCCVQYQYRNGDQGSNRWRIPAGIIASHLAPLESVQLDICLVRRNKGCL